MMKTLFENAVVLTMDDDMRLISNGYVLTEGKNIAEVGEGTYGGEADERIDAHGGILLPGFVNTHCHASMVPFRTMGDDCPDRLRRFLFPLENEAMTRELTYRGAVFGIGEMLLAGTTTFVDMYYFEDEVARACVETGMRGYLGETLISQPTCDSPVPGGGINIARAMFERWKGEELVKPIVAPHGTTTCDEQLLRTASELAEEKKAIFTLHASEMDYEMKFFADRGETPTSYLKKIGALNARLLAAHCIHLSEGDVELLREGGAAVAHCIGSNTKAAKGVAPIAALAKAGVRYGLGTDGPSSGNTLSMFDQMRLFAVCHKTANHDRGIFPAREIVRAATRGGAEALGTEKEFGQIRPGMRADLILVSTDAPHMFPVYNPYSALVYGANSSDVRYVMTGGRMRVRGGVLTQLDMEEARARLLEHMGAFMRSAEKYKEII